MASESDSDAAEEQRVGTMPAAAEAAARGAAVAQAASAVEAEAEVRSEVSSKPGKGKGGFKDKLSAVLTGGASPMPKEAAETKAEASPDALAEAADSSASSASTKKKGKDVKEVNDLE